MTGWLGVAVVVVPGTALFLAWQRRCEPAQALLGSIVTGIAATEAWLALLGFLGVRWSTTLVLVPAAVGTVAIVVRRRLPLRCCDNGFGYFLAVVLAAGIPAVALARVPAFGWDFRYIWGLKARVFAFAGGHAASWLAAPGNGFAHPAYPPLWPDLLAVGHILGATVANAAAAWTALLVVALAVACWVGAAGAPSRLRVLAALAGAFAPVIFTRDVGHSGYAEPLLAVLAALALAALANLEDGPEWTALAALATAALALAKDEGLALAVAIALAALATAPRRARLALGGVVAFPIAWWLAFCLYHGVSDRRLDLDPSRVLARLGALPREIAGVATLEVGALALAWVVALIALCGARMRGVRIALALFGAAVVAAYATCSDDLAWQLATSLGRVLAAPLPGVIALAIGSSWGEATAQGRKTPA
jgi:hypothetical protein